MFFTLKHTSAQKQPTQTNRSHTIVCRSRTKHTHTRERGFEKGDKAESRQLVAPNLTPFFLSFYHNDTLSFIFLFFFQFLIRQIFLFKKLIIVLRCWVLDSNYYSGCCCYIISFRVDFILPFFFCFVLHCCNLH